MAPSSSWNKKPPKTISPVAKQFCQITDSRELSHKTLSKLCGVHSNFFDRLRHGRSSVNLVDFEIACHQLGYELKMVLKR